MFTERHYIAIAKLLKRNKEGIEYTVQKTLFARIVNDFIDLFTENPRFNQEKFLDTIYVKEDMYEKRRHS